jgi:hypothetical protein
VCQGIAVSDNAVIVLVALVGAVQVMTVALINAHYRALQDRAQLVAPPRGPAGADVDVNGPGTGTPDPDRAGGGGLGDGGPAGGDIGGGTDQVL